MVLVDLSAKTIFILRICYMENISNANEVFTNIYKRAILKMNRGVL